MWTYNTQVVMAGTLLLGISAGVVGVFMLLRKRALVGDVVSHAALPGIAAAFLLFETIRPGTGKALPVLLTGAVVTGFLGVLCTIGIRRYTRIKEDAALAIVLSVFFGVGIALLTVVQSLPTGNAAGLHDFIYGKTASMVVDDVKVISIASVVVLIACGLLFKELAMICFDMEFAGAQGWPVAWLDLVLMCLVVGVTVIGLQSVGLLLVVAMLIIPAASARFWTDRLLPMTIVSAVLGGMSAALGVLASASIPRLPAGAIIVLVGSTFFALSLLFGTRRGALRRFQVLLTLRRRVGRHDLLRAFYEVLEARGCTSDDFRLAETPVSESELQTMRTWAPSRLHRLLRTCRSDGLIAQDDQGEFRLTRLGVDEARRVVRNHRLWEIYLINYADIAPSHVDRDADLIEHILDPDLIAELNQILSKQFPQMVVPPSPHTIDQPAGAV